VANAAELDDTESSSGAKESTDEDTGKSRTGTWRIPESLCGLSRFRWERAHTFAFIPPGMTDRYKIPKPCTSCHAGKTTAWADEAMRRWPEWPAWRGE